MSSSATANRFVDRVSNFVMVDDHVETLCGNESTANVDYAENDVADLDRTRLRCLYENQPALQELILESLVIIDNAFRDFG